MKDRNPLSFVFWALEKRWKIRWRMIGGDKWFIVFGRGQKGRTEPVEFAKPYEPVDHGNWIKLQPGQCVVEGGHVYNQGVPNEWRFSAHAAKVVRQYREPNLTDDSTYDQMGR